MDKCPKCGYEFEKYYCRCENLTTFDITYINAKAYCRRCEKEVEEIKATLALQRII